MRPNRLILASASPRRRVILTQAGLRFEVIPSHIDETRLANEATAAYVQRLAVEKSRAILALHPDAIILAADTTVVLDDAILSKPIDIADAERMLRLLSGRAHKVQTGIAIVSATAQLEHVETTTVFFSIISSADLADYLLTGDSLDKAGAYGIQGYAARWIPRIEGDFYNVVGLPIAATIRLLSML
jgi:septum formation protein